MAMFKRNSIITAIDIGTSKICVLIGESFDDDEPIEIIGSGEKPLTNGMRKGEIYDVEAVREVLIEAVNEAEATAKREIDQSNIFISVTGTHINARQGEGTIIIGDEDRKIKDHHVEEAIEKAKTIAVPPDKMIINTFDSCYVLDGDPQRCPSNPIGQVADKLTAIVHLVYGTRNKVDSLKTLISEIGFEHEDVTPVFSGIATAYGCLRKDELERGVLLIDFGAGTTEFLLVHNLGIQYSGVLPIGLEHVANDLSIGLDLNFSICKKILMEQNYVQNRDEGKAILEVKVARNLRKIPISSIEKIIEIRLREIFSLIHGNMKKNGNIAKIGSGIVISGGGVHLPRTLAFIEEIFKIPVRKGMPEEVSGAVTNLQDSKYTNVWGLLKYGELMSKVKNRHHKNRSISSTLVDALDSSSNNFIKKVGAIWDALKL